MPILNNQRKLRVVRNLPFCYLCGQPFLADEPINRDHIPPAALFSKSDRNFPLILRAHKRCNSDQGSMDERIAQLLGLKLGRVPREENRRLNIRYGVAGDTGPLLGMLQGFDVHGAIRRWLRAFHAALYQEPLSRDTKFAIQTPFPSGRIESGKLVIDELRQQHLVFVDVVKRNRAAGSVDAIYCNNGKLKYECVWDQSDDGRAWLCIFALDVYGWMDLGDVNNFRPRGCAGSYLTPSAQTPRLATRATRLQFSTSNRDPTDPFGT